MKGDRIVVASSLMFEQTDEVLPVYKPMTDASGNFKTSFDGSVLLEQVGGVKTGTTGIVKGDPIRVHRTQLLHLRSSSAASLGGTNDLITVFPVFLEQYQQDAWLPGDHIRVASGGRA